MRLRPFYFEFLLLFNLCDSVIPDLGSEPSFVNSVLLWVTFSRKLLINAQKRCYLSVAEVLDFRMPIVPSLSWLSRLWYLRAPAQKSWVTNCTQQSLPAWYRTCTELRVCRVCVPTAGRLCRQSSRACRQHVLGSCIPQAPEFKNTVWSGENSSSSCSWSNFWLHYFLL